MYFGKVTTLPHRSVVLFEGTKKPTDKGEKS